MKILEVIPNLEIGGAQRLIENLAPILSYGNDLKIVVFNKQESDIEDYLEKNGIKIYNLKISNRSPKAIFKLRPFFKWSDIVHLHLFPTHYYGVIANIGLRKPLVFTEHSTRNKRRDHFWLKPIEKIIYSRLSKIVCISEGVKNNLSLWLSLKEKTDKYIVIENGISMKPFQKEIEKNQKEFFGKEGKPLLMISRFTASKDQDTVIKALKHIQDPNIFLVFVGEGERKGEVEKLAQSLGLSDKVLFLGSRYDIQDIINSSFIGIQSSHWEGFGLSAIEMMAAGLPVIASDVVGLNRIVGGAGLLFEKGNPKSLADKINQLIEDEDYYKKISVRCLERVSQFDIRKTGKEYLKLYNSVIKNN